MNRKDCAYNLTWSRKELTAQKLGTFCEYYAKMALASYGMSIYTSETDDHGIDFVAESSNGFLKFQVKSARPTTKYFFMREEFFNPADENLYLLLLLLADGEHPKMYMIPTSAWKNPKTKLFVYHDYKGKQSAPEYGINLSEKNIAGLEAYRIDSALKSLNIIPS